MTYACNSFNCGGHPFIGNGNAESCLKNSWNHIDQIEVNPFQEVLASWHHCTVCWPQADPEPGPSQLGMSSERLICPTQPRQQFYVSKKGVKASLEKWTLDPSSLGGTSKIVPLIFDVLRIIISQCTLGLKCTYYYISLHCARTCEFSCALSTWTSSGIPFHRCYIWRAPASPPGQHAS